MALSHRIKVFGDRVVFSVPYVAVGATAFLIMVDNMVANLLHCQLYSVINFVFDSKIGFVGSMLVVEVFDDYLIITNTIVDFHSIRINGLVCLFVDQEVF